MEIIKLIEPSVEYAGEIFKLKEEIIQAKDNDSFAGCGSLSRHDDINSYLEYLKNQKSIINFQKGTVPSNTYIAVRLSDNKVVGIIDLRHHIDHPVLREWGGHIGYTVRPSERGRGYAKEMLRLNLFNARELGLKEIMITCNANNIASEKTITANGGVFEKFLEVDGESMKKYWIVL